MWTQMWTERCHSIMHVGLILAGPSGWQAEGCHLRLFYFIACDVSFFNQNQACENKSVADKIHRNASQPSAYYILVIKFSNLPLFSHRFPCIMSSNSCRVSAGLQTRLVSLLSHLFFLSDDGGGSWHIPVPFTGYPTATIHSLCEYSSRISNCFIIIISHAALKQILYEL